MTHTGPMPDSAGTFEQWKTVPEDANFACRKCGSHAIKFRIWESNCGGWEDYNYHCDGCGREWWVDGADS